MAKKDSRKEKPEILEADPLDLVEPGPVTVPETTPVDPPLLPIPAEPSIPIRVYATVCGRKWDQMAGFVAHARRQKLTRLTMTEWRQEYEKFLNKPV